MDHIEQARREFTNGVEALSTNSAEMTDLRVEHDENPVRVLGVGLFQALYAVEHLVDEVAALRAEVDRLTSLTRPPA